ncbi:hypothetical protein [Hyalangium sp.]|uniref:hypothetical protein n=1 Tax=Hyalangium sp. TaxID=2028555 RepID=UPI002D749FC7|nr:hypothetical protein [Hyalangium sp.]HYI02395.1 hypothetical protein [Hyalangium sp.]
MHLPSAEKQRLIDRARSILEQHLRLREPPLPWEGGVRSAYDELDDAIERALAGDHGAIATLRRVFLEPGFAMTNSLNEQAIAALALALLGDRQSIQRIRGVTPINLNREAKPLALAILDEEP